MIFLFIICLRHFSLRAKGYSKCHWSWLEPTLKVINLTKNNSCVTFIVSKSVCEPEWKGERELISVPSHLCFFSYISKNMFQTFPNSLKPPLIFPLSLSSGANQMRFACHITHTTLWDFRSKSHSSPPPPSCVNLVPPFKVLKAKPDKCGWLKSKTKKTPHRVGFINYQELN